MPNWGNAELTFKKLYDCDRCGFTYKKIELARQDGKLLCPHCLDEPDVRGTTGTIMDFAGG